MVLPLCSADKSSVCYGELPLFICCLHFIYVMFTFIGYFVMLLICKNTGVNIVYIKSFDRINPILVSGDISLHITVCTTARPGSILRQISKSTYSNFILLRFILILSSHQRPVTKRACPFIFRKCRASPNFKDGGLKLIRFLNISGIWPHTTIAYLS